MTEFTDIEKEFEILEQTDEWEESFKYFYSNLDFNLGFTLEHAKHPTNEKLNRYRNILPYDHSRIKLKEAKNIDYINANLVENKYNDRKYILTQGPLRNTCEHFWQMVWEQNSKGIVMLNRLFEKGMPKCEMYFPNLDDDSSEMTLTFGKFRLNYISEQPSIDYSIRVIECENTEQKETREIYHFHFTNWPDFGEPESTESFLKFLNECKRRQIFDLEINGPPIIHCSAGVGRSGTFILVDLITELFDTYGNKIPCSISNLLEELRTYRMGLVQTHTQYKFAFKAIVDYINQIRNENGVNQGVDTDEIFIEKDEEDADDYDEDEEEDDFYEQNEQTTFTNRPATASGSQKTKRFKHSIESQNRIKHLRSIQTQNRQTREEEAEAPCEITSSTGFETAKPIDKNDLKLNLDFLNKKQKSSPSNLLNKEENDSEDEDDEDDDDENLFATNRNIQTVKINEPRKPLNQKEIELSIPPKLESTDESELSNFNNAQLKPENITNAAPAAQFTNIGNSNFESNNIYQRKVQSSSTETNLPSSTATVPSKTLSEKEKRIAEQVKLMKQKQISHEHKQQFMKQIKPFLIGGGVLLGGFLIFELCKKNLFH